MNIRPIFVCSASALLMILPLFTIRAAGQDAKTSESTMVDENVNRGEKIKTEGLVVARERDKISVRTAESDNITVELTDSTKVAKRHGFLGKKEMPANDIVPGLWIKVKGIGDKPGHLLAESITFSGDDLRTARAIQAGLVPLDTKIQSEQHQIQENTQNIKASEKKIQANEKQIQENQEKIEANQQKISKANQRISELTDYDLRDSASLNFAPGSAELSPEAKGELVRLAKDAVTIKGYVLQVKGFTDSSGNAAWNELLSMRRAQAVIAFLAQSVNIPLTHILAPGAMGETHPVSSNDTPEGRAENRRVEVKVLVSRGLALP
jgi:OmpA-OmpF porin, OOP family